MKPLPCTIGLSSKRPVLRICTVFQEYQKKLQAKAHFCTITIHSRHSSADIKMDVLCRCFESGEAIEYIARGTEYNRTIICRNVIPGKKNGKPYAIKEEYSQRAFVFLTIIRIIHSTDCLKDGSINYN